MKSFLALALLVGVAFEVTHSNSTAYYGWSPNKELTYRFESQVLTGIPDLQSQYAGLKLSSDVVIQTFPDYSLRIRFEKPRFIVVNDQLPVHEGRPQIPRPQEELPQELRQALTQPFVAHLKRGVVEALFVEKSEPAVVTNIKKALLTQLQLDLTASRKREVVVVETNSVEKRSELPSPIEEDHTYFTTEESSVVGDCQTSYTMHKLPKYQAQELEERISAAEKKLVQDGVIAGERSEGEEICRGKEYFEVTKTKHFDNCKERPIYQSIKGMKTNCDFSKAECKELMTQMSASRYIICGSPKEFYIREAQTDNDIMTNPMGWTSTPEKMTLSARVTLMLLKVKSSGFEPLPKPQDPAEKRSLIYEYPRKNLWSTAESRDVSPKQENDEQGYQPILPMPNMKSGSSLVPSFIPISELKEKVAREMEKIVRDIFMSPESCSSKADVAGSVHAIAQSLRSRSFEEIEEIERSIMSASFSHEDRKIAMEIWTDILAMTGSNACVSVIKKKLESRELVGTQATKVLQSALRNIKTPTKELLKEMLELVKSLKHERVLYNTGLIQLSNLIQHACIDPTTRITQFPVRTYGFFCNRHSEIITREFIPYLVKELEQTRKESERLIVIAALGKVGHKDVLLPLVKVVEGKFSKSPLVRSVAVYSLKRLAKLEPSIVRPVLLKMIDNPAENTEVRIAAVSVLPWSQPSVANLQKIAVRSWFEPSKQVASFIHSTLKSLTKTKVPELLAVGLKAKSLETLIKPFQYGIQFSHNSHTQKFVEYLRTVSSVETSFVNTAESIIPARLAISNQLYGGAWQVDGLTFSVYTNGMDHLVDKALIALGYDSEASKEVKEKLDEIREKLDIKQLKESSPESFIRFSMLGFQRVYALDKEIYDEVLEKVSSELRSNPDMLINKQFNLTYTNYILKVRVLLPSMAGFPVLIRRNAPVVFGIKGDFTAEGSYRDGAAIKGSIIPVINGKVQSSMGIISPFKKHFIGAGVEASLHYSMPLTARAEYNRQGEVTLGLKVPEKFNKEFEVLHAFVKPFTVIKSLEKLVPLTKAESVKEIVSGQPKKLFELPLGRSIGLDAKLIVDADYKQLDFPYVWNKLSQHNLFSLASLSYMPVSSRLGSVKIVYNPANSETKDIETRFSLITGSKLRAESARVNAASDEDQEQEIKNVCRNNRNNVRNNNEVRLCEERAVERREALRESHNRARNLLENIEAGNLRGIHVHSHVNSAGSAKKTIQLRVLVGREQEKEGEEVKSIVEVMVKTPEHPTGFELDIKARTEQPKMPYRWDVESLIQEDIKMKTTVNVRYGKTGGEKKDIELEAELSKSEHQKESVRRSPELKKCQEEIAKNRALSSVCIETRHQAASVDKLKLKLRVPKEWRKSQVLNKLEAAAKSLVWPVMYEDFEERSESNSSERLEYEVEALVNRTGDVAQAWIKSPYSKIRLQNVTLPEQIRGVFPLSLRNGIPMRLLQDATRSQAPATCRIEKDFTSTFDNKTYKYELNDCWHLLFKDCSKSQLKRPIAVLAKKQQSSEAHKEVKILSRKNIVELKMGSDNQVEVRINGQVESVPAGSTYVKHSSKDQKVELSIHRTRGDKVISVVDRIDGLEVFYDGKKVEIVAPHLLHNRVCGLCGDNNGENTADLKSPKECLMRHPRFAAYSYMMESGKQQCSIPTEDVEQYKEDLRECTQTKAIFTPLERLARSMLKKKIRPTSVRHLVEVLEDNVCISKTMVKVCARDEIPLKLRPVELSYACLTRGLSKTHELLHRAEAGEEIFQMRDLPTEFSRKTLEPVDCKRTGEQSRRQDDREEEERAERRQEREREEEERDNDRDYDRKDEMDEDRDQQRDQERDQDRDQQERKVERELRRNRERELRRNRERQEVRGTRYNNNNAYNSESRRDDQDYEDENAASTKCKRPSFDRRLRQDSEEAIADVRRQISEASSASASSADQQEQRCLRKGETFEAKHRGVTVEAWASSSSCTTASALKSLLREAQEFVGDASKECKYVESTKSGAGVLIKRH